MPPLAQRDAKCGVAGKIGVEEVVSCVHEPNDVARNFAVPNIRKHLQTQVVEPTNAKHRCLPIGMEAVEAFVHKKAQHEGEEGGEQRGRVPDDAVNAKYRIFAECKATYGHEQEEGDRDPKDRRLGSLVKGVPKAKCSMERSVRLIRSHQVEVDLQSARGRNAV
jgi:hypothetical protein